MHLLTNDLGGGGMGGGCAEPTSRMEWKQRAVAMSTAVMNEICGRTGASVDRDMARASTLLPARGVTCRTECGFRPTFNAQTKTLQCQCTSQILSPAATRVSFVLCLLTAVQSPRPFIASSALENDGCKVDKGVHWKKERMSREGCRLFRQIKAYQCSVRKRPLGAATVLGPGRDERLLHRFIPSKTRFPAVQPPWACRGPCLLGTVLHCQPLSGALAVCCDSTQAHLRRCVDSICEPCFCMISTTVHV